MFKSTKCAFAVISLLLSFPVNFKGQSLHHSGNMSMVSQYEVNTSSSIIHKDRMTNPKDSFIFSVTMSSVIISVTVLVIGAFLSSFILRYLGNVPLAKESIILYMYKDITMASLIACCFVSLSMIDCFINGNGESLSEWKAKIYVYCFAQLVLYCASTSSAVMLMKLYAKKQNVLEPEFPWETLDETVIRIWRGSYFAIMNIFMITTFSLKCYPVLYYLLIADPRNVTELPTGSNLLPSIFVFICIINVIMGIIFKIYKNHDIRTFSSLSAALAIIGDMVFIPMFFTLSFGIVSLLVLQNYIGLYLYWIIILVCQLMIGILGPLATIAISPNLQEFIAKETKKFRTRFVNIWNSFKPTRIYPIE